MARKISSRLEELNLSQDELNRFGEALKKKEFRELLVEYAREINDPVNKKIYEDEITQLENERGVDVKFVHPEPLYVLKTCYNPGGEKVFVNICSNPLVGKPISKPSQDLEGAPGISWSIPLIQAPAREDMDKSGSLCTVYDVLFHPETHALAAKDKRFRNFVEDTALNAVEQAFSVKLDRNSVKKPRMKFKGIPQPTVIRTRRPEGSSDKEDDEIISQFPYPYGLPPKEQNVRELKQRPHTPKMESVPKQNFITPKYVLKESSDVEMSDYEQNHLSHHDVTIPQRLVILVDLPNVKSSSELVLDVEVRKISLVSNGNKRYKLDVKLPYPIQESQGGAKFDGDAGKLIVTLHVDRKKCVLKKHQVAEGDSGIDSDMCCSRVSSGEEEESKSVAELSGSVPSVSMLEDKKGQSFSGDKISEPGESMTEASGGDLHGTAEVDGVMDEVFEVGTTVEGTVEGINVNACMKESENLSKTIEHEEMEIIPPKAALGESNENCPTTVGKGYNLAVPGTGINKPPVISRGLLQPDVPYMLPSFSCNCLKEVGNTTIIYILQVKNVDPTSVKKNVLSLSQVPIEKGDLDCQRKVLSSGALPSENGCVCNEYRTTVGDDSLSNIHSSTNSASVNKDKGLHETAGVSNRPESSNLNEKSSEVSRSDDFSTKSVSIDPSKGISKCDTSDKKVDYMSMSESGVPGANFTMPTKTEEEKLSDEMRDNLVITENVAVSTTTQEDHSHKFDIEDITCFQVIFSSIGAGFFPQNYAFCMALPTLQWPNFDLESTETHPVSVEVWDNNVEIQWRKPCGTQNGTVETLDCFVGKDPSTLQSYQLPPFEEKLTESESFSEPEFSSLTSVSEDLRDELTKGESDSSGTSKENHEQSDITTVSQKRKMFKERTLSESSVESLSTKQATKGILKRRGRAYLGRSLSESSGGEEYSWIGSAQHLSMSSSVTSSPSLSDINRVPLGESVKEEEEEYDEDEEDDDEDGEKVKKIVRFSDVISQKTFRSNSSILGQRKKNQRKLKNKKRAAERRASESENSVDEVEPNLDKQNSDAISGVSPPQKNEIPLPQDQSMSTDIIPNQNKGKHKCLSKKKGNGNKGRGKKSNDPVKSDGDSSGNSNSPSYEFKSDLIFQLELE